LVERPSLHKKILKNINRVVNVLKMRQKIVWYTKKSCDVLIYDGEGSDLLLGCIPSQSEIFIIRNRVETPLFISASFFLWIFLGLIKYKRPGVAIAIIKHLKPRAIITYIDNSPATCRIKKIFPSIPVIAVQNGTRWVFSIKNRAHMEYDHYFSFGSVEADIFSQDGHNVSNFYPIGSLRAGLFRNEYPVLESKKFDLCYISQYNPVPLNPFGLDKWTLEMFNSYREVGKLYFDIIAKYAVENKLSLCIAMKTPLNSTNFEEEREYYSYQDHAKIEYIPQSRFSSYRSVQASRLSFTISSTLGYEALGWGERVIFAKDVEPVASLVTQGSWTDNLVTHRLPELQRLHNLDYSELSFKATGLLEMTNDNYTKYSESARSYYMNYDDEKKPHQIIKNKLQELLEGREGNNNAK